MTCERFNPSSRILVMASRSTGSGACAAGAVPRIRVRARVALAIRSTRMRRALIITGGGLWGLGAWGLGLGAWGLGLGAWGDQASASLERPTRVMACIVSRRARRTARPAVVSL